MREAQERAQAIVSDASEAHAQLVDDHEIVQRARATAETVLREAEVRAANESAKAPTPTPRRCSSTSTAASRPRWAR